MGILMRIIKGDAAYIAALCLLFSSASLAERPIVPAERSAVSQRQGLTEADVAYNLGVKYYTGTGDVERDIVIAIEWFEKAATQGKPEAQYYLGFVHQRGEGVKRNYKKALKWYRLAAAQGDKGGQTGLGDLYAAGHGVARDDAEAARWYHRAAKQGKAEAQYSLGRFYMTGRGIQRNYTEAYFWLSLAAKEVSGAMEKRDEAAQYLTDAQREAVWLRAKDWRAPQ